MKFTQREIEVASALDVLGWDSIAYSEDEIWGEQRGVEVKAIYNDTKSKELGILGANTLLKYLLGRNEELFHGIPKGQNIPIKDIIRESDK